MKKKIIIALVIYLLGVLTPIVINKLSIATIENRTIYEIKVLKEKINLRPEIDLKSEIIREVYKDETFKVVKYYEGSTYNWYNVIYEEGKTGWLASGKENAWVEIIDGR